MLHTRLDTLETVNISDPRLASRLLWGAPFSSNIVKASALYLAPGDNRVPYLRLTPSAKWAVRLIPQNDLSTRAAQLAFLSGRDGWSCFYCDANLDAHTATVEHIVAIAHGGPTHADNLCLTCASCNAAVGALPGVQKVKLAISVRVGRVAVTMFKDMAKGKARRRAK